MTGTIKVKPADGAFVAQPDRAGLPVPPEGAIVADNSYYRRAVLTGDLVEIDETPATGAETEAAADPAVAVDPAVDAIDPPAADAGTEPAAGDGRRRRSPVPEQE